MTADRSNLASFYDPEHPSNRFPQARRASYWVEVLCDDGELHGWGGLAYDAEDAKYRAWDDAQKWDKRPVQTVSCDLQ